MNFLKQHGVNLLIAILVVIFIASYSMTGKGPMCLVAGGTSPAASGDTLQNPAWTAIDLNGKTVSTENLKGKVLVINFWATWCPPCRAEIPDFIKIQKEYANKGVQFIGISVDRGPADNVKEFVKKEGMNYPVIIDKQGIADLYGDIQAIPTSFFVARDGTITDRVVGGLSDSELREHLDALLR